MDDYNNIAPELLNTSYTKRLIMEVLEEAKKITDAGYGFIKIGKGDYSKEELDED